MAEIKFKLECPALPNFIRVSGGPTATISLADIPEEAITALANEWRDAFIAKAREARFTPRKTIFTPKKTKELTK